ncbi:hypothetical protein DXG01_001164 [Tephrocybe rancida]|nr:hypothetical protein DXG01_001164 [Tephrocybe rancida]
MTETQNIPVAGAGSGPHFVRITGNGKIKSWVSFALNFLETYEDRPLVFHTLPADSKPSNANEDASGSTASDNPQPTSNTSKLSKATTPVPRLLTVIEIVKREFIKSLEAKHSPRLTGLHQYNEIGYIEALLPPVKASTEDRAEEIRRALSGSNYVKQKQTPFVKVTLSLSALPGLAEKGATYQAPTIRRLSNSAKMRMKKRDRAAKHAASAQGPVESQVEANMDD